MKLVRKKQFTDLYPAARSIAEQNIERFREALRATPIGQGIAATQYRPMQEAGWQETRSQPEIAMDVVMGTPREIALTPPRFRTSEETKEAEKAQMAQLLQYAGMAGTLTDVSPKALPKYVHPLKRVGVDTIWHETDPDMARRLTFSDINKEGLSVSTSKELALGQKGKGAVLEIDTSGLEGMGVDRPNLRMVGEQTGKWPEYNIRVAPHIMTKNVKSVTFEKPLKSQYARIFKVANWFKELLPGGKVVWKNPNF